MSGPDQGPSQGPDRDPGEGSRHLGTTRPSSLAVAFLAAAASAWLSVDRWYGAMPRLTWVPPVTLLALATVEAYAAWQTKSKIDQKTGAGRLEPLVVARYVVLAKASAMAGAIFAGLYFGMSSWLFAQLGFLAGASADIPQSVVGCCAAAVLTATAIWLERSCRVPPEPPDEGSGPAMNRP